MTEFHGVPVSSPETPAEGQAHVVRFDDPGAGVSRLRDGLEQNRLVLVAGTPLERAGSLFRELAASYGLEDSYDLQMQYVAHTIKGRTPVGDIAVTVNERGPLQIIQPHSEGDTTSQLELFGLHCARSAAVGGENVMSLIDQSADHSRLRAKEKAIRGSGLSAREILELREEHLDAVELTSEGPVCRILKETARGSVIVRLVGVRPARSAITGEELVTYWDNVTVHDRAFHRHQVELLRHLGILHRRAPDDLEAYMHVEEDSPWAPVDTDSGDLARTAGLFRRHVVHKMRAGDFLVLHNRAWTHAVNNWPAGQVRELTAMYA